MTESLSRNSRRALGSQVHAPKGSASGPEIGPKNSYSDPLGRNLKGRERVSGRALSSTLANFVGDLTRIRRRDDRQAGAAPTGWAARAMHIFQAGARRPLYPSWAAMITSADGPSRASPDFPHIPVPLGCNKTPLGRTLLRRVPRQAPPKLAKVELRVCQGLTAVSEQSLGRIV